MLTKYTEIIIKQQLQTIYDAFKSTTSKSTVHFNSDTSLYTDVNTFLNQNQFNIYQNGTKYLIQSMYSIYAGKETAHSSNIKYTKLMVDTNHYFTSDEFNTHLSIIDKNKFVDLFDTHITNIVVRQLIHLNKLTHIDNPSDIIIMLLNERMIIDIYQYIINQKYEVYRNKKTYLIRSKNHVVKYIQHIVHNDITYTKLIISDFTEHLYLSSNKFQELVKQVTEMPSISTEMPSISTEMQVLSIEDEISQSLTDCD